MLENIPQDMLLGYMATISAVIHTAVTYKIDMINDKVCINMAKMYTSRMI